MYNINNLPSFITLGRQGESNVTTLEFDCSPWLTAYPGISIGITLARPGDALSDAIVCGGTEVVGNVLTWTVRAPETERAGTGTVVITGVLAGKRVKSTMVYVVVAASHTAGDTPEWYADYKDAMIDIKAQTVTARAGAQLAETGSKEARDETLGYLDETRAARDAAAQYEQGALEQADRAEFAAEEAETAMLDTLSLRTEYQGYLSDTQNAKQGAEAARDAAAQHEAGAQEQAERAELAAEEAETALTKLTTLDVSATGLPAGSAPTVTRTETDTGISLTLGIPAGQRGEKGDPGEVSTAQMDAAIGAAIAPVNAQLADVEKEIGYAPKARFANVTGYKLTASGRVLDYSYQLAQWEVKPYETYLVKTNSGASEVTLQFRKSATTSDDTNVVQTYTEAVNGKVTVPQGAVIAIISEPISPGNSSLYVTDVMQADVRLDLLENVTSSVSAVHPTLPTVRTGWYISMTGVLTAYAGTDAYAYMPVKPGQKIRLENIYTAGNVSVCSFDSNKAFVALLANKVGSAAEFTIEAGVAYIAFCTATGQAPIVTVLEGAVLSDTAKADLDLLYSGTITLDKEAFIDGYRTHNGTLVADVGYKCTPLIAVEQGQKVTIDNFGGVANTSALYYDGNGVMVGFEPGASGSTIASKTITIPDGVKYITYSVKVSQVESNACYYAEPLKVGGLERSLVRGWYEKAGMSISKLFDQMTPVCCFIDDDTISLAATQAFRDACVAKGIKGTFACVTHYLDDVSGLTEQLLGYEDEGFQITLHSSEHGEYFRPATRDEAAVDSDVLAGLRKLRQAGFVPENIKQWVTPYGVSDAYIQSIARKYGMDCIVSIANEIDTFGKYGRYNIPRPEIVGSGKTTEELCALIDEAVAKNGWVLFCSHFGYMDWQTDGSKAKWDAVVDYALSKGIAIKTLAEAWRMREPIYRLRDMF